MHHTWQAAEQGQYYVDQKVQAEAYLDKGADRGEKDGQQDLEQSVPRDSSCKQRLGLA